MDKSQFKVWKMRVNASIKNLYFRSKNMFENKFYILRTLIHRRNIYNYNVYTQLDSYIACV